MMMSFKCSSHCKVVFDDLKLSFNEVNIVLRCKIGMKHEHANQAVCPYAHEFQKRPGCALIGA